MIYLQYLFLFMALGAVAPASAGISTNGGIFKEDRDNVWNLGEEPVDYCVIVDPKFPIPEAQVRSTIGAAFRDWRRFFIKYDLDKAKFEDLKNKPSTGITLDFRPVANCNSEKDIRFLIGTRGRFLAGKIGRIQEHGNLGLAYRKSYDHDTYRNGGTVWINNWSFTAETFKHIILHEIGHVFGMEHDSVHVMDSRVADWLGSLRWLNEKTDLLGRIETPTWPYRLQDGQPVDFTFMGRGRESSEPNLNLHLIANLFGFSERYFHKLQMIPRRLSSRQRAWKIDLDFKEQETNRLIRLEGKFLVRQPTTYFADGLRGPVLYTRFYCSYCTPEGWMTTRRLDKEPSGMDAEGFFHFRTETAGHILLPAVVEHNRGISIKVFVPNYEQEKSNWWSTAEYVGSYFMRP